MDNQNANSGVRKGSGFTNLSRVLQANQQNRLGSAISSGLTGGSQNVRQQIGDTREDFKQQSEAGRLDTEANRQAKMTALQKLQNTQDASQIKQIGEENRDVFAKFRSGQYSGPQGLNQQNVQQIQREAGNLQQIGQSLGQQDKSAALARFVNPQAEYSKGQRRLDSVLLGAKPVQQQLFQAKQQTRGLQQQVAQEQQNAEQLAKLRANEAVQFAQDTNRDVKQLYNISAEDINKAANADQTKYNEITKALETRSLIPELEKLKNVPLYDINPADFIKDLQQPDKLQAGTDEQRQRYNALAKLGALDSNLIDINKNAYDITPGLQNAIANLTNKQQEKNTQFQNELNKQRSLESIFNLLGQPGQYGGFNQAIQNLASYGINTGFAPTQTTYSSGFRNWGQDMSGNLQQLENAIKTRGENKAYIQDAPLMNSTQFDNAQLDKFLSLLDNYKKQQGYYNRFK